MSETSIPRRTTLIGWIVVGWLLTLVIAFLWLFTDTVTALLFALGIGLGVGIAIIIMLNETLIVTTIQALEKAGESAVQVLNLRKNMRALLAVWIMVLFSLVVVLTAFNQLEIDKFSAIMGVLGSFVASVIAYYFAASRSESPS
jgi:uncharacterized membrane protein